MANHIKETVTDKEKVEELIGVIGGLIKDTEIETSGYKEMEEFRRNFNDLFREAHAEKLVVLIDDLDRCLEWHITADGKNANGVFGKKPRKEFYGNVVLTRIPSRKSV